MSNLALLFVPLVVIYIGIGVLVLVGIERIREDKVVGPDQAVGIVAGWPIVVLVTGIIYYGMRAMQREVSSLSEKH